MHPDAYPRTHAPPSNTRLYMLSPCTLSPMARRTPTHGNLPSARLGNVGRPSALTDRTEDAVIHAVLDGNHLTTAAAAAGISERTLHTWMEKAATVEDALQDGRQVDDDGLRYLQFAQRLNDARAQAEMSAVKVVQAQMKGGYLISDKPLQDVSGAAIYDNNGEVLRERQWAQPDGRLALSYLAKSRPKVWGTGAAARVELTGAGGGPVQVEHTAEQIMSLSERLAIVAAQRREEDADEGDYEGDVVDVEVLDDDAKGLDDA